MKKILATLLTLALLLSAVILPAAADEQSDLLGLWDIQSMSYGGETIGKAELDENDMTLTIEFKAPSRAAKPPRSPIRWPRTCSRVWATTSPSPSRAES